MQTRPQPTDLAFEVNVDRFTLCNGVGHSIAFEYKRDLGIKLDRAFPEDAWTTEAGIVVLRLGNDDRDNTLVSLEMGADMVGGGTVYGDTPADLLTAAIERLQVVRDQLVTFHSA